jgi:hypothetical protein
MKRLIAVLGFTLLAAPVFAKTTLNTSMLFAPFGYSEECNVVNVGSKPVTVLVSITTGDGVVIDSASLTIAPGLGGFVSDGVKSGVYCSFALSSGSAKTVRGSLVIVDPSNNPVATLPAS